MSDTNDAPPAAPEHATLQLVVEHPTAPARLHLSAPPEAFPGLLENLLQAVGPLLAKALATLLSAWLAGQDAPTPKAE